MDLGEVGSALEKHGESTRRYLPGWLCNISHIGQFHVLRSGPPLRQDSAQSVENRRKSEVEPNQRHPYQPQNLI